MATTGSVFWGGHKAQHAHINDGLRFSFEFTPRNGEMRKMEPARRPAIKEDRFRRRKPKEEESQSRRLLYIYPLSHTDDGYNNQTIKQTVHDPGVVAVVAAVAAERREIDVEDDFASSFVVLLDTAGKEIDAPMVVFLSRAQFHSLRRP